jgi:hypothetical protein
VRSHIGRPGFRSRQIAWVTTPLDADICCVADLAELYHQRWPVETALAQLKATMRMEVLHCQTVPGVLKELTVLAIVYKSAEEAGNVGEVWTGALQTVTIEAQAGHMQAQNTGLPDVERFHAVRMAG